MNIVDTQTALKIWPDKMPAPYAEAIERAKAWLGKRYLLAEPLNRPAPLPALLRRQAE